MRLRSGRALEMQSLAGADEAGSTSSEADDISDLFIWPFVKITQLKEIKGRQRESIFQEALRGYDEETLVEEKTLCMYFLARAFPEKEEELFQAFINSLDEIVEDQKSKIFDIDYQWTQHYFLSFFKIFPNKKECLYNLLVSKYDNDSACSWVEAALALILPSKRDEEVRKLMNNIKDRWDKTLKVDMLLGDFPDHAEIIISAVIKEFLQVSDNVRINDDSIYSFYKERPASITGLVDLFLKHIPEFKDKLLESIINQFDEIIRKTVKEERASVMRHLQNVFPSDLTIRDFCLGQETQGETAEIEQALQGIEESKNSDTSQNKRRRVALSATDSLFSRAGAGSRDGDLSGSTSGSSMQATDNSLQ